MKSLTLSSLLGLMTCLAADGGQSAADLVAAAPTPDWYSIQYGGKAGCGLYAQFFDGNGREAMVNDKRIAFFPGGAAPKTTKDACLQYCAEWEDLGIIDIVTKLYESSLGLTHVTGTCYLRGERIGTAKLLWSR